VNARPSGVVTLDPWSYETPCDAFRMSEPYRRDLNLVLPLGWGTLSLDLPVRFWSALRFLSANQPMTFRKCASTPDGEALEVEIHADRISIAVARASDYCGPERRRVSGRCSASSRLS